MVQRSTPAARTVIAACAAAVFCAACVGTDRSDGDFALPRITVQQNRDAVDAGVVDVHGIDRHLLAALERVTLSLEAWQQILAVYTDASTPSDADRLAVLGRYEMQPRGIRFTPRFPPLAGQPYRIRFDPLALGRVAGVSAATIATRTIDTVFVIPRTDTIASTVVQAVYPSADRLPVNLLRLYVHFSAPMRLGEAYERVRLLDQTGAAVEDAFLVVPNQELWDSARRRLTIFFDPGRIKRDLRPHEELGLPLREGRSYTLEIDPAWRDAKGNPLAAAFTRTFSVGAADRTSPRTSDWRIQPPAANTRGALALTFPEALDHALLERVIAVLHEDGRLVSGRIAVDEAETRWTFTPDSAWKPGRYIIEVNTDLEDLAGNNLRGVFDVDRTAPQPQAPAGPKVQLPFEIGTGSPVR